MDTNQTVQPVCMRRRNHYPGGRNEYANPMLPGKLSKQRQPKVNDMRPNQASHRPLNNLGMEMDGRILISFPQIVTLGLPLWRRHIPWANASLEAPGSGYGGDTTGGAFLQSIRSGRDRRPPRILG